MASGSGTRDTASCVMPFVLLCPTARVRSNRSNTHETNKLVALTTASDDENGALK